jgi:hypothetical protein
MYQNQRLVLASARAGRLDPIEHRPKQFCVQVAEGFTEPHIMALEANGSVHALSFQQRHNGPCASTIEIPRGLGEPTIVQLSARGRNGVQTIAERWIGAPSNHDMKHSWFASIRTSEDAWQRLIRLRHDYEAAPLRDNTLLVEQAQEYARQTCESNHIVHELIPGKNAQHRLKERGVDAQLVGEVISRGQTAGLAFAALVRSPSHILTMTDRRFTDAGVGIIEAAKGRVCLVFLFAAWPQFNPQ